MQTERYAKYNKLEKWFRGGHGPNSSWKPAASEIEEEWKDRA